jgi:hypothetical protein
MHWKWRPTHKGRRLALHRVLVLDVTLSLTAGPAPALAFDG